MFEILIVDDEKVIRNVLKDLLTKEGYRITTAEDGIDALEKMETTAFDLVITDLTMPRMDGMALLKHLRKHHRDTTVIVLTAYANLESAVSVVREGAYDYIVKPFIVDEILYKIKNIFNIKVLSDENVALKNQLHDKFDFSNIVGKSESIQSVLAMIRKISIARSNALITGESGTGKELVAKAIHTNSPSGKGPFLAINCGAIPENLLESELFGYKKGSFTGAYKDKDGMFVAAQDGTLFLDEIGEMPITLQIKLLRALEERTVQPIGSNTVLPFNARIVSATNKNLLEEVSAGNFRRDLYYRLNVIELHIPPLRDRKDDLPLLTRHFIKQKNSELNLNVKGIDEEAMQIFYRYEWKGNIRELENVIERAMILSESGRITTHCLPPQLFGGEEPQSPTMMPLTILPFKEAVHEFEKNYIQRILQETGNDKKEASKLLKISLASLYRKLEGN